MAQSLRELILSLKIKADKAAILETDRAFDNATKAGAKFEKVTAEMLWPLKKVGAQIRENTRAAQAWTKALLPAGALPGRRPEAPSDRRAREQREALGMPNVKDADYWANLKPPRPGEATQHAPKLTAPDVSAFLDTRSGPAKALDAVREAAQSAKAAVADFAQSFNEKFDAAAKFIFNARNALAGFVAVAAGAAVVHFVGSVVEAGAELHTMAQRTRLSVETLQVWRMVAMGVNADSSAVTGAFRKLSQAMTLAGRGGKVQAKAFKDLGVEIKGRGVEEVLIDTGAALANMDDEAKATALSVQLLGPAGAALVPAFKGGADAVRKMTAELRENVVMNAEEAARLEEVGSAVERGAKKWTALKTRVIVLLLPLIEAIANGFEKSSKWILRMAKETSSLQTILLTFVTGSMFRLVTMFASWIASVGGARAALALMGQGLQTAAGFAFRFLMPLLLIEDFLTFLAGGKSVFGRAFEEIFGPGGAQAVREGILAVLNEIQAVLSGAIMTALRAIGGSEFFKGGAKLASEGVLAVLHAIGLALADNEQKAEALAKALRKNLEALGLAPTEEHVDKLMKEGLPEDLGGKGREELSPFEKKARSAFVSVFGDPLETPGMKEQQKRMAEHVAKLRQEKADHPNGMIGPPELGPVMAPQAPPAPMAVTLTDNRKIEVNVGTNATPGATGRAVGGAVDGALTKDRRQTLNAL